MGYTGYREGFGTQLWLNFISCGVPFIPPHGCGIRSLFVRECSPDCDAQASFYKFFLFCFVRSHLQTGPHSCGCTIVLGAIVFPFVWIVMRGLGMCSWTTLVSGYLSTCEPVCSSRDQEAQRYRAASRFFPPMPLPSWREWASIA